MQNRPSRWVCTHCGHSSARRFSGDICPRCHMTFWKCVYCAFTVVMAHPPDTCPECEAIGAFRNITCYIPEWEAPEPIDESYVDHYD